MSSRSRSTRANSVVSSASARAVGLTVALALVALALVGCARTERARASLTLYTTTSLYDSGLLDELIPRFEEESGLRVKVVAVGTGEALHGAASGNADAVLVHDPEAERKYARDGVLERPLPVARNFFLVAGPRSDPAGVARAAAARDAFARIAAARATFVSRGDNSGTHARERALWRAAGVDPRRDLDYLETGQGMGETLRIASEKGAYTLVDVGTFHAVRDLGLVALYARPDRELENVYSYWVVRGARNRAGAEALRAFLASARAASVVDAFSRRRTPRGALPLFEPLRGGGERP